VSGTGHLEDLKGPVIFMANHLSFLDTPALVMAIPKRFRRRLAIAAGTDVLYDRYQWIAPLADLLYNSYPLPTGAEENIKPGLEYTGRLLDHGWSVLIFPEGQMNRGGTSLQPLKTGAGMLAVEMQVPVVPVVLTGTEHILPADKLMPRRRGEVPVRFGAPVRVTAATSYTAAAQQIEDALADLLEESE
jgi:long-chain acyl-CoA synthetase